MTEHVAVIGGGQAAASCVARLRAKGFDGAITLFAEEPVVPYQRPPLSKKYLTGEMALDRLFLRPEKFYEDQDVSLRLGVPVSTIDKVARTLRAGSATVSWDRLVLATGARPRLLPPAIGGDLPGVYAVRTLADVDAMAPEFVAGRRVLIVGGGYIGLEAAAVAAGRGLQVTLVEAAERILQRVAAPETSDYFRTLHISHGVEIIENCGLERLEGTDRVTGAVLSDGRALAADFVIVGIGIVPDTALATAAGLKTDNGVAVDAQCRTSDPGIFAIGDCASFPHGNNRLRLESVGNAIDMGETAADVIAGVETAYTARPWFWSDQYDTTLQIAGLNAGYDRVVTRPGAREGGISFWYFKGLKLLAVDAANDPRAYLMGKRWIEAGTSPTLDDVADSSLEIKKIAAS